MRIKKKLYAHAKQRLFERFGVTSMPNLEKKEFVISQSNNRKIYRCGDIFFVWRKSDKKIITFLKKEYVERMLKYRGVPCQ